MATLPDPLTVVRQRMATQRLSGPPCDTAVDVARRLGAVQAQEYAEALWSLARRSRDSSAAAVEAAYDRGEFLRTHVLRPTWHFVAREDIRWLLRLTKARVHQLNRSYYLKCGLDGPTIVRGAEVLVAALAGGPLARAELRPHLERAGLPTSGLPLAYLLMHAELEEIIGSGPRRGRQQTYDLLDRRAPAAADRPVDDLVLRYFRGHGPATVADFTAWSSLTVGDTRAALARLGNRLQRWDDAGGTPWYADPHAPAPVEDTTAYLIPMYDELGIGYRDLRMVLDGTPPYPLERPVLIGGRTVGTWRRTLAARRVSVEVTLFRALTRAEAHALDAEVARFGEHLDRLATLSITAPETRRS